MQIINFQLSIYLGLVIGFILFAIGLPLALKFRKRKLQQSCQLDSPIKPDTIEDFRERMKKEFRERMKSKERVLIIYRKGYTPENGLIITANCHHWETIHDTIQWYLYDLENKKMYTVKEGGACKDWLHYTIQQKIDPDDLSRLMSSPT